MPAESVICLIFIAIFAQINLLHHKIGAKLCLFAAECAIFFHFPQEIDLFYGSDSYATTCRKPVQKRTFFPHFGQRTKVNGSNLGGGHGSTIAPAGKRCNVTVAWQRGQGFV